MIDGWENGLEWSMINLIVGFTVDWEIERTDSTTLAKALSLQYSIIDIIGRNKNILIVDNNCQCLLNFDFLASVKNDTSRVMAKFDF